MKGKSKPQKKEEELLDLSSFPKAYPLIVKFLYNFENSQHRKDLSQVLTDGAPIGLPFKERFKVVTREEIMDCGTRKDILNEESKEPSGEYKDQSMAKSAAARLYEVMGEAMKEKSERYQKIKEEQIAAYLAEKGEDVPVQPPKDQKKAPAKAPPKGIKKEESTPQVNIPIKYPENETDIFIIMQDFPSTQGEIEEWGKEFYAVQVSVVINEVEAKQEKKIILSEEEEDDIPAPSEKNEPPPKTEEEIEKEQADLAELEEEKKRNQIYLKNLKELKAKADRNSPLRYSMITELNYTHQIIVAEEGQENESFASDEKPINSLDEFRSTLFEKLNQIGSNLIKYQKFKANNVKLIPLTKPSEKHIQIMEESKHEASVHEEQKTMEEAKKDTPKGSKVPTPKPKDAKEIPKDIELPKYDTRAVHPYLDEMTYPKSMEEPPSVKNLFFYEKNVDGVSSETRNEGLLLQAMIDQIGKENEGQILNEISDEDQLNQLFQDLEQEIKEDYNLIEKEKPKMDAPVIDPDLENPYQIIFDETDQIRLRYFGEKLFDKTVDLSSREMEILNNIILPGKRRHMMPEVATKSEQLREATKTEMYPFSSLPIPEFERALVIKAMEQMFEEKNPQQTWNFGSRVFEEKLNQEMLTQALYKIYFLEPDVVAQYYERDDALLVGLYFQNPPGRILRKKWEAPIKHFPDFENWAKNFKKKSSEESNTTQNAAMNSQMAGQPGEAVDTTLVELLDIDDHKVGHLSERIKFLYPSDNSVIKVSRTEIGIHRIPRIQVLKNEYVFGIREHCPDSENCEFWLNYENLTKLTVKMEDNIIEEREPGAVATMTYSTGLVVKFLPSGDVIQILSNSITEKREDQLVPQVDLNSNLTQDQTLKYKNGEIQRVITGRGSVIRYLRNGVIEVLYSNGNYAEYKNGLWVTTNNKGLRRGRKTTDNYVFDMEPIPCAHKTDPETLAKVMIRDDGVITITYKDGTVLAKHKDGTQMKTSPDGDFIVVESKDFAPIAIKYDKIKARTNTAMARGGADALLGSDDIMVRSCDGRVVETYLPDKTIVQTYRERQEIDHDKFSYNQMHLIRRNDGGIIKVKEDGEVVVVTPQEREYLNSIGQNKKYPEDIDFFFELFGVEDERRSGVYTCNCDKNKIWTIDDEGNRFIVFANGETRERIAVSLNLENIENLNDYRPDTPDDFEGSIYIDENYRFLPAPKTIMEPFLFMIKNDGTGMQYFTESQVGHYLRCKALDPKTDLKKTDNLLGLEDCISLTIISEIKKMGDEANEFSLLKGIEIPRTVNDIQQTVVIPEKPSIKLYSYRNLIKHPELIGEKRDQFYRDLERYEKWKAGQVKQQTEFGINDQRSEEQKEEEKKIQALIYRERKNKKEIESDEEFKDKKLQEYFKDSEQILEEDEKFGTLHSSLQGNSRGSRIFKEKSKTQLENMENQHSIQDSPQDSRAHQHSSLRAVQGTKKTQNTSIISQTISQISYASFVPNYFRTKEGLKYAHIHGPEIPDPEVLRRMEERMRSSQMQTPSERDIYMKQAPSPGQMVENGPKSRISEEAEEEGKHNPIVALEPEEDRMRREQEQKKMKSILPVQPSNYKRQLELLKEIDHHKMLLAEEYHVSKTKDFNVYGKPRKDKFLPEVQTLKRTNPSSELNEKFISIDILTDRRIKTSSMAPRAYIKAPPVQTLRAQGQHQMVSKAINKRQTFDDLMRENNAMIEYVLADPLKRNLLIIPDKARFGIVRAGGVYQMEITLKNEEQLPQRINLRNPQNSKTVVRNLKPGPIAPGMTTKIGITLKTADEKIGELREEFQIITKTEIYKIPIFAKILQPEDFEQLEKEHYSLHNRPIRATHVKEIESPKKKKVESNLEEPSQMSKRDDEYFDETTLTDAKLPYVPQLGAHPELDPNKSLGEYKGSLEKDSLQTLDTGY